ncbi:tyrosine-type recombinase/integrase [Mesorhizobium sp.]|uniref:tyrosine-type recombinase/integrase n=1 Tax=Mesorhizobium sp. TaxID=1871066 RepID=UPI0025EA34DC|nr:tyrosine-type recombinase/integrase [Mesorhizobium sp.]
MPTLGVDVGFGGGDRCDGVGIITGGLTDRANSSSCFQRRGCFHVNRSVSRSRPGPACPVCGWVCRRTRPTRLYAAFRSRADAAGGAIEPLARIGRHGCGGTGCERGRSVRPYPSCRWPATPLDQSIAAPVGLFAVSRRGAAVARAPDDAADQLLERYQRYLAIERGLGKATADVYARMVRPFLRHRLSSDGRALDLAGLAATDVVTFVVARCPQLSRGAASLTVTALRSLLTFLHVEGLIARSLAACVPSVAGRRLAGLPKGLDCDQVQRLLTSCGRDTSNGCRDFAVLTMLVRLGLRAGEVAKLKLDDLDWRTGEILVRGKGSCIEHLPLPADVGEAVAAYLRHGRPWTAQGRTVFVRVRAPHDALTSAGVLQIVAAAGCRTGLGRIHAHRLRHTAASAMLRAGASLPEVGQVLRHRRALTRRSMPRLIAKPCERSPALGRER